MKRKESLKPNGFLWGLYYIIGKIYLSFKYRFKVNRQVFKQRDKNKGCILLYNHGCMDDHFFLTQMAGFTKVNFVITRRFMFNKVIRWCLKRVRAIDREQFKTDMGSILKMKRITENGGIICIAPAGQITLDGEVPFIHDAIVKLCKMCKVDVYTIRIHGSYFANPKWGKIKHHFPVNIDCVKVLTSDDLKNLSQSQIYDNIYNSLRVVDREENFNNNIIKSKERAKGMEDFLFICPKCLKKYTLATHDDLIECTNCGNSVRFNEYGNLEKVKEDTVMFDNEHLWNKFQVDLLCNHFKLGGHIEDEVTIYSTPSKDDIYTLCECGKGVLYMDKTILKYTGTYRGQQIEKEFKTQSLYQLPFAPSKRFNIPDEEGFFEFVPNNNNRVIEWVESVEAIYKLRREEEKSANYEI